MISQNFISKSKAQATLPQINWPINPSKENFYEVYLYYFRDESSWALELSLNKIGNTSKRRNKRFDFTLFLLHMKNSSIHAT